VLAKRIIPELGSAQPAAAHDSSTRALIQRCRELKKVRRDDEDRSPRE
jgi:hypothetical protein